MKKLRVTWISGTWSGDEDKTVSADLAPNAGIYPVGDVMIFRVPGASAPTLLAVPDDRLVSAVQVEVPDA